jgi:hypothetical protein
MMAARTQVLVVVVVLPALMLPAASASPATLRQLK